MEQFCSNNRFLYEINCEPELETDFIQIPPMLIQPFVENAIKHGIGKHIDGGIVKVTSDFNNNYHELIVQNSGRLNGNVNGDGFGLSSTRNRLYLLFGDKAKFDIAQVGELVVARVLIPKS